MSFTPRWSIALVLSLAVSLSAVGKDDDDDDDAPPRRSTPPAIAPPTDTTPPAGPRLNADQQQQAGITVQTLSASQQRPRFAAYAHVLDIQPLLELNQRRRALDAERNVSNANLAASGREAERLGQLHRQDAVSARSLQQAQAQAAVDRARSSAATQQLALLRQQALQQWGPLLADWALDTRGNQLERLIARQDVLLLVALPGERHLEADVQYIQLSRHGDPTALLTAQRISAAPRTGELTQGETWFFIAPANTLRSGMRLEAWIETGAAASGVEFPVSAVLWRASKPWVYVQDRPDHYQRRLIPSYYDKGTTWFVSQGVTAGERLVISGAQLLLSEEFRGQIPDEDDD